MFICLFPPPPSPEMVHGSDSQAWEREKGGRRMGGGGGGVGVGSSVCIPTGAMLLKHNLAVAPRTKQT